jgi:hypothetical protein
VCVCVCVCVYVCVCVCLLRTTGSAVAGCFTVTAQHSSELFHTFHVCMLVFWWTRRPFVITDLLKHRNRHTSNTNTLYLSTTSIPLCVLTLFSIVDTFYKEHPRVCLNHRSCSGQVFTSLLSISYSLRVCSRSNTLVEFVLF